MVRAIQCIFGNKNVSVPGICVSHSSTEVTFLKLIFRCHVIKVTVRCTDAYRHKETHDY